jgi:SpoIID/LytB domain protein
MGQWGSLGYAVDHGWSYEQILDHYYGGTSLGNLGSDVVMTVRMTRFDGLATVAMHEGGQLRTNATQGSFTALRAHRVGANTFAVEQSSSCNGPWSLVAQVPGPVTLTPGVPNSDDRGSMVQACEPDGTRRWLRGDLQAVDDAGVQRTVNRLGMESYLRGVVPRESPASWGSEGGGQGMQALRAQAVAARSYAQSENRLPGVAKTCDTTSCQVYGGVAAQPSGAGVTSLEHPNTDTAIRNTSGQVRVGSGGSVVRTEFSSSTGGWTAGGIFPAVPDLGDSRSPHHNWTASIPVSTVESAYPDLGSLQSVDISQRNGLGDGGGRVIALTLRGSLRSVALTGPDFRTRFGLRSDWFFVAPPSGQLDVFVRDTNQALHHKAYDNGRWYGWGSPDPKEITSDPAAVSWGPGRIDVFARGTDNALWHKPYDNGRWYPWRSLGGVLSSGPDVSSWGAGRLDVFVKGTGDGLHHIAFDHGRWHGWSNLGGALTSDPGTVSWGPGRIDVFARGTRNELQHKAYDGGRWHDWADLGGALTSGPDVSSWGPGRLDVFAKGWNEGLHHKAYDDRRWYGWKDLGGVVTSDPGAVSWGPGRIDVFARGTNQGLHQRAFDDGRWHPWDQHGGVLSSGPDVSS